MDFRRLVVASVMLFVCAGPPAVVSAQDNVDQGKYLATVEGAVVAARAYDISAVVDNKIRRIHFLPGQIVKKGDLLVEFDTAMKKLEVAYAEAAYDRARWQFEIKQELLHRSAKLRRKNVVSEARFRDAELNAEIAAADMRLARAELDKARLILEVQKLYAPFDGQMSKLRYRENANVDIDRGTEIATIVQLNPIHVRYVLPYASVARQMREGRSFAEIAEKLRLRLKLPDGHTYAHVGKPISISAAFDVNPATHLLTVLAEFPNPQQILRPGIKVTVERFEK